MKIVTIVGARPQFVKAAVVSRALAEVGHVSEVIVHTGQHYDPNMSAVFFEELSIPNPQYHLGIGGGSHGAMTGRQLEAIEQVLITEKPDWLLVYGDTNSTLAGALAAAKMHIPVAHVEAGLRSFNRRMPEEINRILTDHVASLLLTPSKSADANLANEGVATERILNVGDVMFDATLFYGPQAKAPADVPSGEFLLVTIHRAENTDNPERLRGILNGLAAAGRDVVLPLHPRTRAKLNNIGLALPAKIHAIDPVGYLEMLWLEARCAAIVTDSGGVQKEAYFHDKRCVTVRDETEWVELVDIGVNEIVGVDPARIAAAIERALQPINADRTIYGSGDAGRKIVAALTSAR
ncbi:non-hydrolyzing UDP-N-acetylglucosamine 2-epimerase [Sphingomonas hankookensis]|uniref:UDP-N-acetylglucosamine 2-epimerase (Non-hydrolyzing) n=1 Tax=Sphingomonas hengshuiensis TaxID=1609977 RepID=A0A2W4Z9I2_9SPHN|nr:MAG: UDP-N-acetylglucosamine 2-epimerase (non-hydrolyzing) [Sphingomonas hengshuiensis]